MYTKLTLNIDQNVVKNAKLYAKNNQRSISKLVEEYLSSIVSGESSKKNRPLAPITKELVGIIRTHKNIDPKELLTQALMEKYL